MELIPTENIEIDPEIIREIDEIKNSIYRLIIYSRHHKGDDLLDMYLESFHDLRQLLGIKNAQMEAQTEEEAAEYLENLKITLEFVFEEITSQRSFEKELQLFHLLRLISPDTHQKHPNRYRDSLVQVGNHICPDAAEVSTLVPNLFLSMTQIRHPVIRAIYFHHELIRIHPFADANGRVTRIAKNWLLMFNLYPPIFINDAEQKAEYVETLSESFSELADAPFRWNKCTEAFFDQEISRLLKNAKLLYHAVDKKGWKRFEREESPD